MLRLSTSNQHLPKTSLPRHFLPGMMVACVILMSAPFPARAQSCPIPQSSSTTCDCSATINPGACGDCSELANITALGCALSGNCDLNSVYQVFNQCLANMGPTQPPPPTPVTEPNLCTMQLELVSSKARPLSRRFGALRGTPVAAAASSCAIVFLDPVPDLQTGSAVTTDGGRLTTLGRAVTGIAADSAARVVLRIPARKSGDSFQGTVSDDRGFQDPASLGGLYSVGRPDSSVQSSVTVTANYADAQGNPYAIAVYRAPSDFVRRGRISCGG